MKDYEGLKIMGIKVFRPLAIILPVEAMPLLILANGAITQFLMCGVALTVIAGLAIGWLFVSANKLRSRLALEQNNL